MTADVFVKLIAIFATILIGWVGIRLHWFGKDGEGADPARMLGLVAMYIFVPALLFRTMARLDLAHLPWTAVQGYFLPALVWTVVLVAWLRRHPVTGLPAAAATRGVGAVYGNGVQLGVPFATALFGEQGLAIHIALVSLHGLILLTTLTVFAEVDLARHDRTATLGATVRTTLRNSLIHPVVLPTICGVAWNLTGWPLPAVVDQTLAGLGSAVVPMCLIMIGMTLGVYGVRGQVRQAAGLAALKLLVLPALVLVTVRWGFGVTGLPLQVCVMMAALPSGTNALIFAQRYRTLEPEATAVIVLSTAAFAVTASLWLAVLAAVG
jgi:malonate transporter and related proteins